MPEIGMEQALGGTELASASAVYGHVPIIDMSMDDAACAEAMWQAAHDVGFFVVVNHGIPEATIDAAFDVSLAFFSQPVEAKEQQSPFEANSGYEYMKQALPSSGGKPDPKESIQMTARRGAMDGRWPGTPGFEPAARELMSAGNGLCQRILALLEPRACPRLPPGTLADTHNLWGDDGQSVLRMLHYPPVDAADARWRIAPHTDWSSVTLLFQRPGGEGLECAAHPRAAGPSTWLRVDPVPGGVAANVGDMLGRWADGRLLSNLHRVRMPTPEESRPPRSRHSIAFFMQADRRVLIESETHEAITAGDFLMSRFRNSYAPAEP